MAHLGYRRGGWELRYRDPAGRQRVERFDGKNGRKPPPDAAERLAQIERQLRWRVFVGPEQRAATFGEYYDRWAASRQISRTKRPVPQPVIDALAEHIARYVPDPTDREAFLSPTSTAGIRCGRTSPASSASPYPVPGWRAGG